MAEGIAGGRGNGVEARLSRIKQSKADEALRRQEREAGDIARGRKVGFIHETLKAAAPGIAERLATEIAGEGEGRELQPIILDAVLLDDIAIENLRANFLATAKKGEAMPSDQELIQMAYANYQKAREKASQEAPKFGKVKGGGKMRAEIRQAEAIVDYFEDKTKSPVYTDSTRAHAATGTNEIEKMANESGYRMVVENEGPFVKIALVPMNEEQLMAYAYKVASRTEGAPNAEAQQVFSADDVEAAKKEAVEAALAEERAKVAAEAREAAREARIEALEKAALADREVHDRQVELILQAVGAIGGPENPQTALLKQIAEALKARPDTGHANGAG